MDKPEPKRLIDKVGFSPLRNGLKPAVISQMRRILIRQPISIRPVSISQRFRLIC